MAEILAVPVLRQFEFGTDRNCQTLHAIIRHSDSRVRANSYAYEVALEKFS
ncbi:MAG: hypothetical protein EBE86_024620 [Hormoscilla sp. GUM202]|nr:hypothetical protein [Hormoscilla sp. GUM202]